jgi:hypothetical protein
VPGYRLFRPRSASSGQALRDWLGCVSKALRNSLVQIRFLKDEESLISPPEKPQVPPLRYAPVGMTILLRVDYCFVASIPVSKELSSRPERSAVEGPAVRRLILGNVFRKPIPQPLQPESPLSPCHRPDRKWRDRSVAKWRDLQCALRLSQILPLKRSQMNHPLGIRPSPQPDFACRSGCGTRLSNNINTTGSTHPLIWTALTSKRTY